MSYRNRVTHRTVGTLVVGMHDGLPLQGPMKPAMPTMKPFNADRYWASVAAFCQTIKDYIAHMADVRAGMTEDDDQLAA